MNAKRTPYLLYLYRIPGPKGKINLPHLFTHFQIIKIKPTKNSTDIITDNSTKDTREINASEFLKQYKTWCDRNYFTEDKLNSTNFGNILRDIDGIEKRHSMNGSMYQIMESKVKAYLIKKHYLIV